MSEGNLYAERVYQRSPRDTAELEKNVNDYPFSSLASFLLLYHYQKNNDSAFETFAKKTALNFSNALWLQFLLSGHGEIERDEHSSETQTKDVYSTITDNAAEPALQTELLNEQTVEIPGEKKLPEKSLATVRPEKKQNEESGNDDTNDQVQQAKSTEEAVSKYLPENENVNNNEDNIVFDPLHTIDYFASQGIRLSEEEIATNDKLGNQMKSFTAWLKSMKKLHPAKLAEQSIASEKQIQVSSEASNLNTDILTEAMAEVLIKQNKKEKAIDMYTKLSLINPAKSGYFAARIESIKQR